MGDGIKSLIIFLTGLGIGSAATWYLVKTKYEKIADEEINEMREYYRQKEEPKAAVEEPLENNKPNITEYVAKIDENGYVNYSDISKTEETEDQEEEDEEEESIYVISPDEFSEFSDYDTVELTYWSDGYVTDDNDELMTNDEVEAAITWMALTHMGEYEDDALHVRNEIRKTDYEILQVHDSFKEEE